MRARNEQRMNWKTLTRRDKDTNRRTIFNTRRIYIGFIQDLDRIYIGFIQELLCSRIIALHQYDTQVTKRMDIHVYILSLSSHTCLVTLSILCIHVHVYIIDQVSTCLLGITCEMTVGVTWTWSYTSCISSFIEQVVTRGLAKKRL